MRWVVLAGAVLSTLGVVVAGFSYAALNYAFNQIERTPITGLAPQPDEPGEPQNWLLVGSDSRENLEDLTGFGQAAGSRADVIIIVQFDPDRSGPVMLALPRDLLVELPCRDFGVKNRINAALQGCREDGNEQSGQELIVNAVTAVTGIAIHHYVEIDFSGFQRIVDAAGGVQHCFPHPARDAKSGLDIPAAGCRVLDGAEALAFVRSRHYEEQIDGAWRSTSTGDLARIDRQRDILFSLFGKVKSFSSIGNFSSLANSVGDAVILDDSLSLNEAIGLAWDSRNIQPENLFSFTPATVLTSYEGLSVLVEVRPDAENLYAALRTGGPLENLLDPRNIRVQILDGSGQDGKGRALAEALATFGFQVSAVDASGVVTTTQVLSRPADAPAARLVLERLAVGVAGAVAEAPIDGDVQVILGADYPDIPAAFSASGTETTEGAG